jgi:hypothetical protein
VLKQFKDWINTLARPKQIRLPDFGGELTLKNVSPEMTDKIKTLVLGGKPSTPENTIDALEEETEVFPSYTNTALGVFQNTDGLWCVAVIKFDPRTKKAMVDETIKAGFEREEAEERLKILSAQKGVIRH